MLTKTAKETPAEATYWSRTMMAKAAGISPSSVGRIWREAGLKPHRIDTFKVSSDPHFEEKVADFVGPCRDTVATIIFTEPRDTPEIALATYVLIEEAAEDVEILIVAGGSAALGKRGEARAG